MTPSSPNTGAPQTSLAGVKRLTRMLLSSLKLNARYAVVPGISAFGLNVFIDPRKGPALARSQYALDAALALGPKSVMDVGSGGGYHAKAFSQSGAEVLCIDFGTSVYAKARQQHPTAPPVPTDQSGAIIVQSIDFNAMEPREKYDLVWASHVLEHQRNPGHFIEKLIACCASAGHVCITLPDPHRNLWGGHLSLWTPGLLAYNVVLCGVDLSHSSLIRGTNEFTLLFQPKPIKLPVLTYDSGDIDLLAPYMPAVLGENRDPWQVW